VSEQLTAREKLAKYCTVTKELGRRGDVLLYGRHKYRMNRLVANLSDEECDKIVKIMELDAHITKQGQKAAVAAGKRNPTPRLAAGPCGCGCGAMTRPGSKFKPGHDMKLKCILRKDAAGGGAKAEKARGELKARGWA
jgi:hypothetical protein